MDTKALSKLKTRFAQFLYDNAHLDVTLVSRIIVKVGKILKNNNSARSNKAVHVGILVSLVNHLQILINMKVGKFLKFNKVCNTIIPETRV